MLSYISICLLYVFMYIPAAIIGLIVAEYKLLARDYSYTNDDSGGGVVR